MDSLARTRERRVKAGSRMAHMLEQEEDDFYKSTYGGFFEEEDDREYETEGSESDYVDSDFDCEENEHDEPIQGDDEEPSTSKKKNVPYKEKRTITVKSKTSTPLVKPKVRNVLNKSSTSSTVVPPLPAPPHESISSKSLRTSTQLKKEATEKRKKQAEGSRRKHQRVQYRELTQAELLAEAKQTERTNLASLARYEMLELEKARKNKSTKLKEISGSYVRYRSLSMPKLNESDLLAVRNDQNQNASDAPPQADQANRTDQGSDGGKIKNRYERTLITFSDDDLFEQTFAFVKFDAKKYGSKVCPITKLPARYFDPVTRLPYANAFAFRTLREAYIKQLQLIEPSGQNEELKRYLDWYHNQNNRENINTSDANAPEMDNLTNQNQTIDQEQNVQMS